MTGQFVDPAVSRRKFEAEIRAFRELESEYNGRGWFLVSAEFPTALVLFASSKLRPPALIVGALFDYTNYDAVPPSVRLVDPFTRKAYLAKELPTALNRRIPGPEIPIPGLPPGARIDSYQQQPLMQFYSPEDVPFLCVAGVKEYHEHPAHSGDPWELQRAAGAGRLARLADIIWRYGVAPVTGYSVTLVPQVGLQFAEAPE